MIYDFRFTIYDFLVAEWWQSEAEARSRSAKNQAINLKS